MGQAEAMNTGPNTTATSRSRKSGKAARRVAAGVAVAGAVGLGLLTIPAGAGAAPALPPVSPEDLISSVLTADAGAFGGTVELDNSLGLPALPNLPQAANGTSTARIWSDGEGRGRVQLPTSSGERTLVSDGTTFWAWNSEDSTVTKAPEDRASENKAGAPKQGSAAVDPTAAATEALQTLRATSDVRVDGTAEVAGRAAYELVLTPAASERTLLREVRLAVDAEKRVPLRLTVLANGSTDPALQIGFTDLTFGGQDPAMFTFTPPPGATVEQAPAGGDHGPGQGRPEGAAAPTVVGDGWDTVAITAGSQLGGVLDNPQGGGAGDNTGGRPNIDLSAFGTPVSGSWGKGTLISTAVASAIVTDDGRVAAGAVPEQVLTEALSK
jgi:outer membrane lipoprotein-sorting protein